MKKTFALKIPGKNEQRLLESIKYEIRKYIKRERNKKLPENVDYWDFDCKFSQENKEPQVIHVKEINKYIDEAAQNNCEQFYLEILSKPARRVKRNQQNDKNKDN